MSEKDREMLRRAAGSSGAGTAHVAALARSFLRLEKRVGEMDGRGLDAPSPKERKLGIGDIAELKPLIVDTDERLAAVERVSVSVSERLMSIEEDLLGSPPESEETPDPVRPTPRATAEIGFPSAGDVAKSEDVERQGSPKPVGETPESSSSGATKAKSAK